MFNTYHFHIDSGNAKKLLKKILKRLTMAEQTLDQLLTKVEATQTSLNNVRADIAEIKAGLPTEGGLTAEEVATLSARLDALSSDAAQLDSENGQAAEG